MKQTLDLLHNRISLRRYADKQITDEELNTILEATLRAPSAGNMMNYSIIVVRDEEKKKKLSKTCDNQPFIAKAPVVLIFLADMQRLYDYFAYCEVERFCKENEIDYQDTDFAKLFLAISDALIAAHNSVIAAESLNIGSCYIGDITENYEIHKEMFNLPDKVFPIAMLTLGHYPEDIKRVKTLRFDQEYIVFNEEYKRLSADDFINMYHAYEEKFVPNNQYNAKNFGQLIYARKFGSHFAQEMERSIKVILKNWLGKSDFSN